MYMVYFPRTDEVKEWTKEVALEVAENEDIEIDFDPDEYRDSDVAYYIKEKMDEQVFNQGGKYIGRIDEYVFFPLNFTEDDIREGWEACM